MNTKGEPLVHYLCQNHAILLSKRKQNGNPFLEDLKTEDRISQLLLSVAVWLKLWFDFRLLWFILFNFAIYYGYLLYTPFLDAWHNEPTVIATDQADFPVEKLPFPAITICSNNKIVYRQLESVLRSQPWKGLNKSILNFEENFIRALTALVTAQDDPQRLKELSKGVQSILNDYKNELPKVLRQVKLNFSPIHLQICSIVSYLVGNANM